MKTEVSLTYLFVVGFHWGEFKSIQFPAEVRTRYLWYIEPHTAQQARENPVDEIRGKKNLLIPLNWPRPHYFLLLKSRIQAIYNTYSKWINNKLFV